MPLQPTDIVEVSLAREDWQRLLEIVPLTYTTQDIRIAVALQEALANGLAQS